MWNFSLTIDCQMLKNVIENLLLIVEMRHNIPIELTLQLESQLFDIGNIVSDLNRWQIVFVLFVAILSWFGNQISEY